MIKVKIQELSKESYHIDIKDGSESFSGSVSKSEIRHIIEVLDNAIV